MTDTPQKKLFHRAHYFILAKRIKEQLEAASALYPEDEYQIAKRVLEDLSWALAGKLSLDSEEFDPHLFFTNCGIPSERLLLRKNTEG